MSFEGIGDAIFEKEESFCPGFVGMMAEEMEKSNEKSLSEYLHFEKKRVTNQSVILIGVHDVKTLKLKISPDAGSKFNSPWNIAIDFKVDMSFNPREIEAMLTDYSQERGVRMDTAGIAEQIYYYTSGYPYLVSKLCKFADEDILPQKQARQWDQADIEAAFRMITYGG